TRAYPLLVNSLSKPFASVTKSASCPSVTSITETDRRAWSDSANDSLQQRHELIANAARRFHHFVVIERCGQNAGGHVGDARNAEHFDPHVARGNRFRHCRHSDRVGANRSQVSDLRRGFVTWTHQRDIHAVRKREPD